MLPKMVSHPVEPITFLFFTAVASELAIGAGKLIHPLRVAVTGRMHSPGIFEVLVLLGKERSLARIEGAIQHIRALSSFVA